MSDLNYNLEENTKYVEKELVLERSGYYKKTNCYVSKEIHNNEALIKGIYIVRENIIGEIPFEIKLKLIINEDLIFNKRVLLELFSKMYSKDQAFYKIINEKYFSMIGLFTSPKICKKKEIFNHVRYAANSVVNNILIHKNYLPRIPDYIFYELKWVYKELPPEEIKPTVLFGQEVILSNREEIQLKRVIDLNWIF